MFSLLSIFSSISDIVCLLSFPLPNTFFSPYVICVSPQIRFGFHTPSGKYSEHTLQFDNLNCSVLPKFFFLGTTTSADFLLLSHTSLYGLSLSTYGARSHGINQYSFFVYLLGLRNRVTVTFGTSLLIANLSAYYAFLPSFCPSGYDFAIPSSRLHLTM